MMRLLCLQQKIKHTLVFENTQTFRSYRKFRSKVGLEFRRQNRKVPQRHIRVDTIRELLCQTLEASDIKLHERESILKGIDMPTLIMTIPESLIYDLFILRYLVRISILIYVSSEVPVIILAYFRWLDGGAGSLVRHPA